MVRSWPTDQRRIMENKEFDSGELKSMGRDVFISPRAEFRRPYLAEIGDYVSIDTGFYCTTQLVLGNFIHIGPYVTVIGGKSTKLECRGFNNIMAGARMICGSDRFDGSGIPGTMIPEELRDIEIIEPIVIEEFANVGTNAIVLPGSRLRKGVLISAGSLLIGDTEEWGVYKGNPAVLVKKIDPAKILENAKILGYRT